MVTRVGIHSHIDLVAPIASTGKTGSGLLHYLFMSYLFYRSQIVTVFACTQPYHWMVVTYGIILSHTDLVAPIASTGKTGSGPSILLIHELSLLQIAHCHCVCVYGQHNPGPLHSINASLNIIFSLLLYNSLDKRHAAIAERAHGKGTWRRSWVLKNLRA